MLVLCDKEARVEEKKNSCKSIPKARKRLVLPSSSGMTGDPRCGVAGCLGGALIEVPQGRLMDTWEEKTAEMQRGRGKRLWDLKKVP